MLFRSDHTVVARALEVSIDFTSDKDLQIGSEKFSKPLRFYFRKQSFENATKRTWTIFKIISSICKYLIPIAEKAGKKGFKISLISGLYVLIACDDENQQIVAFDGSNGWSEFCQKHPWFFHRVESWFHPAE